MASRKKRSRPTKADVHARAERVRLDMAYDRDAYANRIHEVLGAALVAYYKADLLRWTDAWDWGAQVEAEVRDHLKYGLLAALMHPVKGFSDLRDAVQEVIDHLQAHDEVYLTVATRSVLDEYPVHEIRRPIDEQDTAEFWRRVITTVDSCTAARASTPGTKKRKRPPAPG